MERLVIFLSIVIVIILMKMAGKGIFLKLTTNALLKIF